MKKHLLNAALVLLAVQAGVIIANAVDEWQHSDTHRAHRAARALTDDNLERALADWTNQTCECECVEGCDPDDCACVCDGACARDQE